MKIVLRCHPQPDEAAGHRLSRLQAQQWLEATRPAPKDLGHLSPRPGGGGIVLCSAQTAAVAAAQRLFPDRRIEVKGAYLDPRPSLPKLPWLRLKPLAWQRLALAWWSLAGKSSGEEPETFKRRIIEASVRLTEVAKQADEAVLVAGPLMLGRIALKLASIGWRGRFMRAFAWDEERSFEF